MMNKQLLFNNLFELVEPIVLESDRLIHAKVRLIPSHRIFSGHFPGNPILPGVCSVQIIKEIIESYLGKDLMLAYAGQIKYLGFINPSATPVIMLDIEITWGNESTIACNARIFSESALLCTFKGKFNLV
jgi:3-hydroxyacyl-[acyl-carrier-protein] dehydratase